MSCPTFVCTASYSMAALLVAKLTPADVTPVAPARASWTVAAQLAHVIPSMGRIIRVLLMLGTVEFVRRRRGAALDRRFHNEQSLQHVHAAAEGIFAWLIRGKLDGGGLKSRQLLIDAESLEHQALGAIGCLVPVELQAHGLAGLHDDRVGRVAALDRDSHFLHPARAGRCRDRRAPREEEVPQHPADGPGAERRDGDLGGRHPATPAFASAPARVRAPVPDGRRARSAWRRTSATRTPAR